MDLKKRANENERQFIWRLGLAKDNGVLDMNWDELGRIFNKELRGENNEEEWYDQSAYRKPYQYAKAFYDDVFAKMIGDEYSDTIRKQTDEIYKQKKQLFDQRREYNKLLAIDARAEHLNDCLIEAANRLSEIKPLDFNRTFEPITDISNDEAVLVLADWHYGMTTDNLWNTYNTDICRERVAALHNSVCDALTLHKPKTLHIVMLGDMAHGCIHTSARVASEELVCDQIMQVSEILAELISDLAHLVPKVKVYSTYGNHLRSVQSKKDSIHADNMEKLIPWWLRERLIGCTNVEIIDSEYKEFIKFNVLGYNICCTHGDLDNIRRVGVVLNTLFTKKHGETIDYTITADKHHLEEIESFSIENILVRSLCGVDDYANDNRLYSNAGQSLIFFREGVGRNCTYNFNLQ